MEFVAFFGEFLFCFKSGVQSAKKAFKFVFVHASIVFGGVAFPFEFAVHFSTSLNTVPLDTFPIFFSNEIPPGPLRGRLLNVDCEFQFSHLFIV